MADLYANEDFPLPCVEHLRHLGHDVLTSSESGRASQAITDEQVLAFATAQQRAVVTHNRRHFIALHERWTGQHAGIIVCTVDVDFTALAERIDEQLRISADCRGKLIRVNRSA
jgi:hypothetical protein